MQLDNYILPHTVILQPIYRAQNEISTREIKRPIELPFIPHKVTIDSYYKRGGEAVVYKGTMNGQPVIIKTYIKSPRTLLWISQKLAPYTPIKYLLFEDLSRAYFVVMEQLHELVYNSNTLTEGLAFINLLESIGARHGDISPGNVMQNVQGNLKFIDFARPAVQGTPFYSKGITDRKSLARTLLSYKYQSILSTTPLLQEAVKQGNKATLALLYRNYLKSVLKIPNDLANNLTQEQIISFETQFFNWFQQIFTQDADSQQLIAMAN